MSGFVPENSPVLLPHSSLLPPHRLNLPQHLQRISADRRANFQKLHDIQPPLAAFVFRYERLRAAKQRSDLLLG